MLYDIVCGGWKLMKEVTKRITKKWERALHGLALTALALLAAAGFGLAANSLTAEAEEPTTEYEVQGLTISVEWPLDYGYQESEIPDSLELYLYCNHTKKNSTLPEKITLTAADKDVTASSANKIVWTRTIEGTYYLNSSDFIRPTDEKPDNGYCLPTWATYTKDPEHGSYQIAYTLSVAYVYIGGIDHTSYAREHGYGFSAVPELRCQLQRNIGTNESPNYINIGDPSTIDFSSTIRTTVAAGSRALGNYYKDRYRYIVLNKSELPEEYTLTCDITQNSKYQYQYKLDTTGEELIAMVRFVTTSGETIDPDKVPEAVDVVLLGKKTGESSYTQYAQSTISQGDQFQYDDQSGVWMLYPEWTLNALWDWSMQAKDIDGYTAKTEVFNVTPTRSVYSITYTQDAGGQGGTSAQPTSTWHCTHHYVWVTHEKATAIKDGTMRYQCEYCGTVKYTVPITAYYAFNKDTQEKVLNAGQGATVKVQTPLFISFHEMVLKALQDRPDVTLVVDYKSGDSLYEMTIPAGSGTRLAQLFGDSQYAGFLYLGGAYETTQLPDDTRFDNVPDYLLWVGTEYAH